ncbi:MAG: hypothetical protein M1831_007495 [Alyxoria varia]|nr:MAG: hypothetical protein M1831_007495 [Alyxoria varia]
MDREAHDDDSIDDIDTNPLLPGHPRNELYIDSPIEETSSDAQQVAVIHSPPTGLNQPKLAGNVTYGPQGVRGLTTSRYVFGAAFLASLGGFSFGYDQGVISVVIVMEQFQAAFPEMSIDDPYQSYNTGLMTAMLEFGAFLGCFLMPSLADTISRKWAITVVVVVFCLGSIIQTAAKSYMTLVFGRLIGGVGVGTLAMGAPLYISEIAPPHLRGTLLVLEAVSIVTGVCSAYWISYGTSFLQGQIAFRLPFGLQMACAILLGIGIHFYPYSPRWLALIGRKQEALDSLAQLRDLPASDDTVKTEWEGIIAEVRFQNVMLERTHPRIGGIALELLTWFDLFKRKSWRRTAVGVGVGFFQQFSGINAFIYYAPILFRSLGQTHDMSLILSGILNLMQLIAVIICFFIIDLVGRRSLAINGAIAMTFPYVVMSFLAWMYSGSWKSHQGAGWLEVSMAFPETKGKTLEEMDELFGDLSGREENEVLREATETISRMRISLEDT